MSDRRPATDEERAPLIKMTKPSEAGDKIAKMFNKAVSKVSDLTSQARSTSGASASIISPSSSVGAASEDSKFSDAWGDVGGKKPSGRRIDDDFKVDIVSGDSLGLPSFSGASQIPKPKVFASSSRTGSSIPPQAKTYGRVVGHGTPSLDQLAKPRMGKDNRFKLAMIIIVVVGILWLIGREFKMLGAEEQTDIQEMDGPDSIPVSTPSGYP